MPDWPAQSQRLGVRWLPAAPSSTRASPPRRLASPERAGAASKGTGAGSGNARTAGKAKIATATALTNTRIRLVLIQPFPCERCVWVRNIAKVPVGRTGIQIIGDKQALRPAAQFSSAKGCPRSCQQHANVRRLPRSRAIAPRVRQVRERLPARGRWIRTFGSPTDPLRFSRQQLTEARIAVRVARLVFSRLWPVHHVGS